jgi:hypothetical protein
MQMSSIEDRRAIWRAKIASQKASGLTIAAWCAEQGISPHTFSYWRAKFVEPPVGASDWVSIASDPDVTAGGSLCVRVGAATVEVSAGFDARLLSDVVTALSRC